ncbi:PREDICTED: uncharacterized protein LOC109147742 [Ipomoea nil]|uniref:uncharacterized protein LOC109147742 n=1 Tax=Ipomoea nil TaxID=35883 RepID=UPI000900C77E|nr:PREDICTED: uncharacterized protein LOC109147742 [Ipomoea nil]
MSILSWNCRGLGNLTAIRVLADLVRSKRPQVVFLIETFADSVRMETVRVQLGFANLFCVDADGHSGGLAMLWTSMVQLQVTGYSSNHIDTTISLDVDAPMWHFTGYYGFSDTGRRREAWQMLRRLAGESLLPWVIMGDYNDLLHQSDKRGRAPHPPWQINGFRDAVADCGLLEMPFDGVQFTWTRSRGLLNMVEEKLDRIFVTPTWQEMFDGATATSLVCPYSDHLPLLLTPVVAVQTTRRRRFLFDNMWLREHRCREIVAKSWEGSRGRDVMTKLQWCGRDIWRWGKNYNKDFLRRIENCKATMDALRERYDNEGLMRYARAENELLRLLEQQHLFWKQRAKEHWRRRNKVKRLKDGTGNWVEGEEAVGGVMLEYFQTLFKADDGNMQEVIRNIASRVSTHDNARMLKPVTAEEVRIAVFQMHPDKSPGPDGLGPGFFQQYWDIVGPEVTLFCREFVETAHLPERARNTYIVLIPKKTVPESMGDLRPIALCNVVYKIAAKVCANRMKVLLDGLISGSQSAFVPGRLITDNVMLAYEVHHYLKRKTQGKEGVAALKIDMSKAYDRVQWRFLEAVLVKMGFARHWVNVLLESVSAVRYHILYEQRELGPIVPKCGLRQGDPLSPYLFLFVVEGLSVLIEEEMSMGRLHGARVARGAPAISHLLFADDCFLFLRANIQESERMRYILDTYATAANVSQPVRDGVVQILGVAEGNTTGKYLGLPSLVGRKKREILGYLKERILTRVRSWNSKFLSRAGREVLLKNVIQAMPSYAMMVFLLPLSLCKEIETLMNEYWWTGSVGFGKGIRWRAWEGLAQPKAAGGLGFRKLHEMNLALLGKQAWRLVTRPQTLVARVYKARYFPRCAFFDSKEGSNPSYIWRGLLAVKDVVREGCRRSIGNGLDTTIGNHAWLPCEDNPFITTALTEEVALASVASLLNNQGTGWDVNKVTNLFNARDVSMIMNIPVSLRKPSDSWYWYWDQKGAYTVKSCYKRLNGAVADQRPWTRIWNLGVPPKVRHFGWQLANSFLPTCDALNSKRVYCSLMCHVCRMEDESARHMFAICTEVQGCWTKLGIPVMSIEHGNTASQWFLNNVKMLTGDLLAKYVMTCWGIWTSRNENVWNGIVFNANVMLRRTMNFLENWGQAQEGSEPPDEIVVVNNTRWLPPPVGKLKLNSDATVNLPAGAMGYGWVLRGDDGSFFAAKNVRVSGTYSIKEAEAMSLREALSWLKNTGMGGVVVEINSQLVYNAILSSSFNSAYGFLVDDIKELASAIGDVEFQCVRRFANCAAHVVAREAFSVAGCGEWFDIPPVFLVSYLANDLIQ